MTDGLLPGADRDLVNILAKRVDAMCEAVLLKTKVTGMKEAGDGISVTFEGKLPEGMPNEQTFDRVLVSIGRRPNSAVPGLEKTRREGRSSAASSRSIEQRRTAEPTIFAIGDVVGEPMLAHKASHEARVAIDAIAGRQGRVRAAGDPGGGVHRPGARVVRPDRSRSREAEASRSP